MASAALAKWQKQRATSLNEMEGAHRHIGGSGRGRRFATQQVNRAYAVLLSSEFQGFCRDLYIESSIVLADCITPQALQPVVKAEFRLHLKLERGNPNPGNIGSDFNRLGLDLWKILKSRYVHNNTRQKYLEELNVWRNAIAHNDFTDPKLNGNTEIYLSWVRGWRRACDQLASEMDIVLSDHLRQFSGMAPW